MKIAKNPGKAKKVLREFYTNSDAVKEDSISKIELISSD